MIENFEVKAAALRTLVGDARDEQRFPFPNQYRMPNAPAFSAAGFQTCFIDALVESLKTTDALDVLHKILSDKETSA